jgi:hypothetical protein
VHSELRWEEWTGVGGVNGREGVPDGGPGHSELERKPSHCRHIERASGVGVQVCLPAWRCIRRRLSRSWTALTQSRT